MNQTKLYVGIMVALMALFGADGGCERQDVPAGSVGGDSAGNNQPGGGKAEACNVPGKVRINPISYEVRREPVSYSVSAYLLDGECDIIESDDSVLKVTLAALDSIGRRVPPIHDSRPSPSPYSQLVTFALPTAYSIELAATGNLNRDQVKSEGVVFIGCSIIPARGSGLPLQIKTYDIGAGKGKAECKIAV